MSDRVYYRKELASTPFIALGAPVPFEPIAGNRGVIKLDPQVAAPLIGALDAAIKARKGGIVKITEEEYEALKKKQRLARSVPSSPRDQPLRVFNPHRPPPKVAAGAAATAATRAPSGANPPGPTAAPPAVAGLAQAAVVPPKLVLKTARKYAAEETPAETPAEAGVANRQPVTEPAQAGT